MTVPDDDAAVLGFAGSLHPTSGPASAGLTTGGGLTVGEFAALAGVGLVPVRPVVAALAVRLGAVRYPCPYWDTLAGQRAYRSGLTTFPPRAYVPMAARGSQWEPYAAPLPELRARLEQARDAVLQRLLLTCRQSGGHGVLGVVVEQHLAQRTWLGSTSTGYAWARTTLGSVVLRLRVTGTVVRSVVPPPPPRPPAWLTDPTVPLQLVPPPLPPVPPPWTTTLSGTEVAAAVRSGLAPSSVAWEFGVAMRHGPTTATRFSAAREWGGRLCDDGSMPVLTDLLGTARRQARDAVGTALVQTSLTTTFDAEPFEYHRHVFAVATLVGSHLTGSAVPLTSTPQLAL